MKTHVRASVVGTLHRVEHLNFHLKGEKELPQKFRFDLSAVTAEIEITDRINALINLFQPPNKSRYAPSVNYNSWLYLDREIEDDQNLFQYEA